MSEFEKTGVEAVKQWNERLAEPLYTPPLEQPPVDVANAMPAARGVRELPSLTLKGERIVLQTHLGKVMEIERTLKISVLRLMEKGTGITFDTALDILAICANRKEQSFKQAILAELEYQDVIEIAQTVLLCLTFPGDIEKCEKKVEELDLTDAEKNEFREKLGLPKKTAA